MTCMHEKLRISYNTFVTKCLDEKERQENDIQIDVKRLILPGEEDEALMFESTLPQASNGKEEEKKEQREEAKSSAPNGQPPPNINGEDESQYNIEDTNESFSERKHQTNIPALKNNKNALNKRAKPFSDRIYNDPNLNVDPKDSHSVANQMIFEVNLIAGQML